MEERRQFTINVSTGSILKVVGILLFVAFLYSIRDVLLMFFISVIFATLIEPIVSRLERYRIPRGAGVATVYIVLILFLVLVARLVIPPIAVQVAILTESFPSLWDRLVENYEGLRTFTEERGLLETIQNNLGAIRSNLQQAATSVYGFIIAMFRSIFNFLIILVLTFYLVAQKGALEKVIATLTPPKYHDYLVNLFVRIQEKIGAWARGQLLLGVIVGLLSFIGLLFVMPRYALMLALVAGLTELIPYLGPTLGAIPAVFLAFTVAPISMVRGLVVLALYVIIQQVENNFLVPQVMRKSVGLNPVIILLVMLIGMRLAGVIGIIIAIPVATAVQIVFHDFIDKSELRKTIAKTEEES